MKTIPPTSPEPQFGRKYWRSLDQLAETPEFRQWVERQFPQGASEWRDPVSRRHFVKIMGASFLLGGLGLAGSGCRRQVEKILPFSKLPENYVHGMAQYYATAMPTHGSAVPLVVKSNDGRPTKIEGNKEHPDSNGGTDRWAQASILSLYDPDRAMKFKKGGNVTTPQAAFDFLAGISTAAQANGGKGLAFLVERSSSPSRQRLQKQIAEKFPQSQWYVYEPVDLGIKRRAASQAFAKSVKPYYHFDKAKVIVSLDCDFLGSEEDVHTSIRRFAQGRKMEKPEDSLNRLYVVESLYTLTGFNSDHRLRTQSSAVAEIAAGLAGRIGNSQSQIADSQRAWIEECAKDLVAHKGECLVVAGYRQPLA